MHVGKSRMLQKTPRGTNITLGREVQMEHGRRLWDDFPPRQSIAHESQPRSRMAAVKRPLPEKISMEKGRPLSETRCPSRLNSHSPSSGQGRLSTSNS